MASISRCGLIHGLSDGEVLARRPLAMNCPRRWKCRSPRDCWASIHFQNLFAVNLALLLRQRNPRIAVLDAPDPATALAEPAGVVVVLVDILQAGQGHFAGLALPIVEAPRHGWFCWPPRSMGGSRLKAVELGARGDAPKIGQRGRAATYCLGLVASGEVYLPREELRRRRTQRRPEPRPQLLGLRAGCRRRCPA